MALITCYLTYVIDPDKLAEFEHYARLWMRLVERFGGTHYGYYLPAETDVAAAFSFPEIAGPGPDNVAFATFSFPGETEYEHFRQSAAEDPECRAATDYQNKTKCFLSYRRSFVRKVER